MGQYYRIWTQYDNGRENLFDIKVYYDEMIHPDGLDLTRLSEDDIGRYDSWGVKLMEHSWFDNMFTNTFSIWLYEHKPLRLVWCGDYAHEDECKALGFSYDRVWGYDNGCRMQFSPLYYQSEDKLSHVKYFVNITKKLYVDLEKAKSVVDSEGWSIYPISLLTALGNDRGGGDYHDCFPDFDKVGTWAGDFVTITEEKPEYCTEFDVYFIEKRNDD